MMMVNKMKNHIQSKPSPGEFSKGMKYILINIPTGGRLHKNHSNGSHHINPKANMESQIQILVRWITKHQIVSFFLITFVITWGLGFSFWAVFREGRMLLAPLVFLATCGPALAGIIINIVTGSHHTVEHRLVSWGVFLGIWIFVVAIFIAHSIIINGAPVSLRMIGVIVISTLPVAFITSMTYTRSPICGRFQQQLTRIRDILGWIVLSLLLLPGLSLISIIISSILGRPLSFLSNLPTTGISLLGWIALEFLYQFYFFNGTGEEVGWRGFVLPRLQMYTSPLVASLLISLFWVPWHLFLWLAEGRVIQTVSFWAWSYLLHVPSGVTICWLFNRSHGRVLVAGTAHAADNTALALPMFGNLDPLVLCLPYYAFSAVIVFMDRMWKKLPIDHPAVDKTVELPNIEG